MCIYIYMYIYIYIYIYCDDDAGVHATLAHIGMRWIGASAIYIDRWIDR